MMRMRRIHIFLGFYLLDEVKFISPQLFNGIAIDEIHWQVSGHG